MELTQGQQLAHYRIDSTIGQGGMGTVYRATDTRLDREVAIKVLPAEVTADVERRQRFRQEALLAAAFNHSNIATVHDVGEQAQDARTGVAAELTAADHASAEGLTFVSPYNDLEVIAGQGTVGMELAEQLPSLDAVFVAVGGGGLVSGLACALKNQCQGIEIVGCWPEVARSMHACLEAGQIIDVEESETLSDGTAGGVEPGAVTFDLCRDLIDRTVLVSESEIGDAMRRLARDEHWMVEGAAGVALASLLKLHDQYRGRKVAVVLCGRNIALEKYYRVLAGG